MLRGYPVPRRNGSPHPPSRAVGFWGVGGPELLSIAGSAGVRALHVRAGCDVPGCAVSPRVVPG